MQIALYPSREQIEKLLADPAETPVVMLNLLRFKPGGEGFHVAGLVEYPSRKAFVEVASSPEVAAISGPRAEGLEGPWLLASTSL